MLNSISSSLGPGSFAAASGPRLAGGPNLASNAGSALKSALAGIKNEDGESLADFRDQLKGVAEQAMAEGGPKEAQAAVMTALEDNGFDVDEIRSLVDAQGPRGGRPAGLSAYGSSAAASPRGLLLNIRA